MVQLRVLHVLAALPQVTAAFIHRTIPLTNATKWSDAVLDDTGLGLTYTTSSHCQLKFEVRQEQLLNVTIFVS